MPDWADLLETLNEVDVPSDIRDQAERRREPSRRPRRRRKFVSRTASVVAVAVGCGAVLVILAVAAHSRRHAARPSAPRIEIVQPDDVRVTTRIIGGSPGLRKAIHDSLAGVGQTAITTVTVSRAGKRYGAAPQDGVVLTFTSRPKTGVPKSFTAWQEGLVGAATRDRALLRGLEPVVFSNTENMGSRILAAHVPPRSPDSPTASQLIDQARQAAQRLGVTLDRVTVLQPLGLAIYVAIDVPHPGPYLAHHSGAFAQAFPESISVSSATSIDGWYIDTKSDGEIVATDLQDSRSNTSTTWINPAYSGCSPAIRGNPVGVPQSTSRPPPPPCPGVEKAIRVPSVIGDSRRHATAVFKHLGLKVEPVFLGPIYQARRSPVTDQWPQPGAIIGSNHTALLYFQSHTG